MIFDVTGVSGLGKNRVREHGREWEETHTTSALRCDAILLRSTQTGYMRWVQKSNDPDFAIKEKDSQICIK